MAHLAAIRWAAAHTHCLQLHHPSAEAKEEFTDGPDVAPSTQEVGCTAFCHTLAACTLTGAGCIQQPPRPLLLSLLLPQVQQLLNTLVVDTEIAEMELQVCFEACTQGSWRRARPIQQAPQRGISSWHQPAARLQSPVAALLLWNAARLVCSFALPLPHTHRLSDSPRPLTAADRHIQDACAPQH